ncbi:EamA family transporter [Prolixibacteraceae bacterium JC049]|nr:EamA family transporter [Prolixibacteraceae bacterium JC049]
MEKRNLAYFQLNVAILLFGVAGLFGRWISLSAQEITFGRVLFGAIAIGTYWFSRSSVSVKITTSSVLKLVGTGALLAFHWFSFFHSIQVSSVAIGLLGFSIFSVWATLLESIVFKERIKPIYFLHLCLILVGIWIIVPEFSWDNQAFKGMVWAILSGLSFAFLQISNRKIVTGLPSQLITGAQFIVAAILMAPFVAENIIDWSLKDITLLILLGTVFTALAHTLFIASLKHINVRIASMLSALEPVYGIVAAAILLKELPGVNEIAGGLVILLTVIWVVVSDKRH